MKTYKKLYEQVCSYENLETAFEKAKRRKTTKAYVVSFEKCLKNNLLQLQSDLLFQSYCPKSLEMFIIRDPKTRKIHKSDFRDRIVHHALCNIIEPIFERNFIYDSYANRIGKGCLKAVERFDVFKRKVSQNGILVGNARNSSDVSGWVLKADIYHYFEEVPHKILLQIIQKKIKDNRIIWLIKKILGNYESKEDIGMPLGNLTSQFFANVYLNELDQFVKHELKIKYYIRYVDDFVIIHKNPTALKNFKSAIDSFLKEKLELQLHPQKCRIQPIKRGVDFLGFKHFYYHRILRKKCVRNVLKKLDACKKEFDNKELDYDSIYQMLQGWMAYAKQANSYLLRQRITLIHNNYFQGQIPSHELNRNKQFTTTEL